MDARKSAIFAFQLVKRILQTVTHLMQYKVLEIQCWSVKCTATTVGYAKISSNFMERQSAFSTNLKKTILSYKNNTKLRN